MAVQTEFFPAKWCYLTILVLRQKHLLKEFVCFSLFLPPVKSLTFCVVEERFCCLANIPQKHLFDDEYKR